MCRTWGFLFDAACFAQFGEFVFGEHGACLESKTICREAVEFYGVRHGVAATRLVHRHPQALGIDATLVGNLLVVAGAVKLLGHADDLRLEGGPVRRAATRLVKRPRSRHPRARDISVMLTHAPR